jgi:hypothetical protein
MIRMECLLTRGSPVKSETRIQIELTKQVEKADDIRNMIRNDPSGLNADEARAGLPIIQNTIMALKWVLELEDDQLIGV